MSAPAEPRRSLAALILLGIANHSVLVGSRVAVSLAALALGASIGVGPVFWSVGTGLAAGGFWSHGTR